MNGTENGSEPVPDGPKSTIQNSPAIQENNLLSPSRVNKRVQKEDLIEISKNHVLPIDKQFSTDHITENKSVTSASNTSEKSCCSKNPQYDSSEYLFGFCDQEIGQSQNLNHRFYGCKRNGFPSPCSESFGLPDDPIFSNSPIFLDRTSKSPLDIDLADPWDISVVDLENVDQPWLVECPEVITPYWDVESLFPFEVEDIRQKIEPECDLSKQRSLSDSFNISGGILDNSSDNGNESDSVFTSTPVKIQNNSLSVVSTINITNGEENTVNISALKDEVLKALEEAIKNKNNIGNIDMKIQIVTDLKSPVISPKKNSIEVRINEKIDTESGRSTSSSKENYFIENAQDKNTISKKIPNAKELSNVTLSNLNEDWQDSQASDENERSQDESSIKEFVESSNSKKTKKHIKNKKYPTLGVRRSLRFNVSTTNDKEALTGTSVQLSAEDSSVQCATSRINKKVGKTTSENQLLENDVSILNNVCSHQSLENNLVSDTESQSSTKRILRSSQKEDTNKYEKNISSNHERCETKDLQNNGNSKLKDKGHTLGYLQIDQVEGDLEVSDRSKRKGSQSSQDESDYKDTSSRNKAKSKGTKMHSNQDKDNNKNFIESSNKSEKPKNTDSQINQNGASISNSSNDEEQVQGNKFECSRDKVTTSNNIGQSETWNNLKSNQDDLSKVDCSDGAEETSLSQDDEKLHTNNTVNKRVLRYRNNDSQSTPNENEINKDVLENVVKGRCYRELLQLNQGVFSINSRTIGRKLRRTEKSMQEDSQCSQDESDISKDEETNISTNSRKVLSKKKKVFKEDLASSQDESDVPYDDEVNVDKNIYKKLRKRKILLREDLSFSQNESDIGTEDETSININIDKNLGLRHKTLIKDLESSQDESDVNKDNLEKPRRKGRSLKIKVQKELDAVSDNCHPNLANQESSTKSKQSLGNTLNNTKEQIQTPPVKRTLRSSTQNIKTSESSPMEGRRRTLSHSVPEKGSEEKNNVFPNRRRAISANYDSKNKEAPTRRSLRSQAIEPTKVVKYIRPPVYLNSKNPKAIENSKSPKISFNLSNSFKELPKKFETDSPLKSILKNVYDAAGRLIGVKIHREKHVMMPSSLEIKPEDEEIDEKRIMQGFKNQTEPEIDSIKKEDEVSLRENGITSQIKIVISPLEIKEETDNGTNKTVPVLPSPVSKNNALSLGKSGQISDTFQANVSENKLEDSVKTKRKNGKINDVIADVSSAETKEIKIEETAYNLGNFVWAQVGKYPFWPAIVCNDPITETFQKEVVRQNMSPQIYYHIRFFGDHGRRAWVYRKHIMLYCSNEDLEKIANKLKSENKNYNIIKPYLVSGLSQMVEKWHKAVEELDLLKNKTYENIIKHMLESYENYLKNRRKRKLNSMTDASESESEETDPSENIRRKKFKSSEHPHVTADSSFIDTTLKTQYSKGFDEILITMGNRNITAKTIQLDKASEDKSENAPNPEIENEISNKQIDKKPRRSMKDNESGHNSDTLDEITLRRSKRSLKLVESLNVTAEFVDKSLEIAQPAKTSEGTDRLETPNVSSFRLGERRSLRAPKSSLSNEMSSGQSGESENLLSGLSKKQPDEGSEAESKTSSDGHSINSNMYSFEYQVELHKKNNLFNGLRNVKVCDYCFKQGDLYKCKGKCGGFFHLECASKVTQPRANKKGRKKEKSPIKVKVQSTARSVETTPKSDRNEERLRTKNQVQIITIKSKHAIGTPKKINLPPNFDELSLSDQIDYGMKEMMSKFESRTVYADSTDSSSEEGSIIASKNRQLTNLDSPASSVTVESEKSATKSSDLDENGYEEKSSDDLEGSSLLASSKVIKHVTADSVILTGNEIPMDITNLKCTYCRLELDPPCFACGLEVSRRGSSIRRKCSQHRCGRYYHPYCLKMWPQAQWSIGKWSRNQEQEDCFTCPTHTCHTCFSEELGSAACRLPGDKLARCMLCPAGFHSTTFCIPAGTEILGGSQIVCPRHRSRLTQPINTVWCFICSEGGNLVCCDTCPTSVHPECQPVNLTDDDKYICEDCESGRFPLYDEIVWVKLGQYRWWPALVLFPNETPENVRALKHQRGDFAVRFFGTNDHYWVNKARSFLFQEGDRGGSPGEANKSKNKVYETFGKAIEDAALAYKLKKEFKLRREAESINSLKPPTYIRINKNRPVGNVKSLELDLSNATTCECDPNKPHPCGPDSNCINRLLMTECDPDVCSAGSRCRNQLFQRREYPPMIPYKTQGRGWGLKCLAPIKKGQFVIEYVGELIDSEEYQRRIQKMHEQKEENYYFMTVDCDRMIDAGPKGNLSRFMNHCCNPNCVTQKWTVRGDTRVGLFAKCDIESGSELTFNYNLEVVGQEKKVCKCGASNCSGFIGVKAKSDKPEKPQTDPITEPTEARRPRKYTKKRAVSPPLIPPCFMCGRKQSDLTCNNKFCNKGYHLKCLKLEEMPEVTKFTCPRHNCNICSNRTIRCCVKCTNSFCPSHSEGNVRHDKFLGFVCRLHDPERSEFEPAKSTKRRRYKPESTDESIVSSTTSDKDSILKEPSHSQKPSQKETSNAQVNDSEKDDPVSSTPPKEPFNGEEAKETGTSTSEDEISLDQRLRRRSESRNPRKKIRVSLGSSVSTAKTS